MVQNVKSISKYTQSPVDAIATRTEISMIIYLTAIA